MSYQRLQKADFTENDIQFIMANTDFERDQIIRWHEEFVRKCPSNKLDKSSFVEFFKKLIPGESPSEDEFCAAVFRACDLDANGFIDFNEFLIAFWIRAKGNMRDKLSWLFDIYDKDGNRSLTLWELASMLKLVIAMKNKSDVDPYDLARSIMNSMDRNADARISKQEFIARCTNDQNLRDLFSPY